MVPEPVRATALLSDRDIKTEVELGRVKLDPYTPELIQLPSIDVRMDRYFRSSKTTGTRTSTRPRSNPG